MRPRLQFSGHIVAAALSFALALGTAGCRRESRDFSGRESPGSVPVGPRLSTLQPGRLSADKPPVKNLYDENAYALSQGKMLYSAFNCVGCHAQGGGSIGPALMDAQWRYGNTPEDIYATIMAGRPNGMPSFAAHLTEQQAWQLAAYVRSLGGLVTRNAAPNRDDAMKGKPAENSLPRKKGADAAEPPAHP